MNLFPISPKPRSSWSWVERALLLVGIVCLGIWAWSWLDARVFEMEQNEALEKALAAPAQRARPPAAETDALGSFQPTAAQEERPAAPAPEDGELIGRISIPRVGVSAVVVEGVGKRTLRRGAGHIPDTAMPFQAAGNVGIAAHRDSFFRGLKDIREDDTIELTTLDGTFRYQVEWTRIVKPTDTSVLAPTEGPALTLVTCYPFYYVGSAPKRFIVRAHRIDEETSAGP